MGLSLYTPDVLTAAGLVLAELKKLNTNLTDWRNAMSAQADALTAEVAEVKRVLAGFVDKFNQGLAALQAAQGDEQAMTDAVAALEATLAPIRAIVEPPPAPPST